MELMCVGKVGGEEVATGGLWEGRRWQRGYQGFTFSRAPNTLEGMIIDT